MLPTHRSSRILLPVNMGFVYLSLGVALLLDYIPTGHLPGVPDFVALTLTFWCIREPLRIGMGAGLVFGLLSDIGVGAAMGQHALAYVVLAYSANALSRRILWFPPLEQALHVLPLLFLTQVAMVVVRLLAGAEFPGWWMFLGSFVGALLWVPVHYLLLMPQMKPVDRDDNRPI
ncbi:MAG: rod shape-determining protein MreD [Zoogloea sp.]|nr:rod shape-determining protein MreD [Zoogloea sp.]